MSRMGRTFPKTEQFRKLSNPNRLPQVERESQATYLTTSFATAISRLERRYMALVFADNEAKKSTRMSTVRIASILRDSARHTVSQPFPTRPRPLMFPLLLLGRTL